MKGGTGLKVSCKASCGCTANVGRLKMCPIWDLSVGCASAESSSHAS